MSERDEEVAKRIEAVWRRLAARPTSLSPSEAARAVTARLGAHPARVPLRAWAYATALVLACAGIWFFVRPQPSAPVREVQSAPPPLPDNVVQWWLDDKTPVYFVLSPSDSPGGV
jgi:ferric-dicitrate binding protein FerR (iron transport regulator)